MIASQAAPERPLRVLIAGGFTGGHIFCALAIAGALQRVRPGTRVSLVGARGGMELPIARAAGFPVDTVWLDGLERRLSPGAILRSLALPLKLGVSLLQARLIMRRFGPDVVVGVGAYVSFPSLAVAAALGVPVLIHEANARPGIANKVLARGADVVCVGMEEAAVAFRANGGRRRVVPSGNPVRAELSDATAGSSREARLRLGLGLEPERRTLLVMGGSLGASRLNEWMLGASQRLADGPFQVLWQAGAAHAAGCRARLGGGGANIRVVGFLDDMPSAYAAADLVVAGAGAMTLAELTCLGKPAIVVPDRNVSEDHQLQNAAAIRAEGGLVHAEERLGDALTDEVEALLRDDARLQDLGARMARLARPRAADRIATEIVTLALAPRHRRC